jgi:hypothetical protein
VLQGAVLVSWDEGRKVIGFVWDPVGFFSFLLDIIAFFVVISDHPIRLTNDKDSPVRSSATKTLGSGFSQVPDLFGDLESNLTKVNSF